MRKSTARLRKEVAEAEQADDAMAAKLQAALSWIDKAERAMGERADALKASITEDHAAFVGEMKVLRAEIAGTIAELRGTPVQIDHTQPQQIAAE